MKNSKYTAVLLAAGYGSRIRDMINEPKCLLTLEGKTLIEKNFEIWRELGIKQVNLVLGYKRELIIKVAEKYSNDFNFKYFFNENYKKQGNTFSLLLGIQNIRGNCLIFDADLVYEKSILENFIKNGQANQILVGKGSLSDIESTKTMIDENGFARMTIDKRALSKEELKKYSFAGEALGILKFSAEQTKKLASMASKFLSKEENLHLNWEHLLNQYLLTEEVRICFSNSDKWIEIDTSEDFKIAKSKFEMIPA